MYIYNILYIYYILVYEFLLILLTGIYIYTVWLFNIAMENPSLLIMYIIYFYVSWLPYVKKPESIYIYYIY